MSSKDQFNSEWLAYVRKRLKIEYKQGNLTVIAQEAGINYQLLLRIARGDTKAPSVQIIEKIYTYFTGANRFPPVM